MRALSKVAPEWWDYTTLDRSILDAAAKITINDLKKLERPGFKINIFDTIQEFYAAEALEYIKCWQQATASNPAGICGPIGPTEQLPIVAQIVNDLDINLKNCHFWGMDEWIVDGKAAGIDFPLGFAKADWDLCFSRIRKELRMPDENMHFPTENPEEYTAIADFAEGNIRRWSVAPEVEGAADFAKFAKGRGIALSIAHSNADLDTVRSSFELGYRHITHFYSCISTITRRNGYRVAGLLEAGYLMDGMDVEIIADGSHIPPDLLRYVMKFKSSERIALITDAMRAAGQSVSESFLGSALDPLPVIVEDGVAKLTDRSAFAGSVATADMLIKTMLKIDTPLPVAVKMLTANPLRMMKLDVNKGLLKAGYDADVCIFDEGINVKAVLVMGEVAYRA